MHRTVKNIRRTKRMSFFHLFYKKNETKTLLIYKSYALYLCQIKFFKLYFQRQQMELSGQSAHAHGMGSVTDSPAFPSPCPGQSSLYLSYSRELVPAMSPSRPKEDSTFTSTDSHMVIV